MQTATHSGMQTTAENSADIAEDIVDGDMGGLASDATESGTGWKGVLKTVVKTILRAIGNLFK